MRVQNCALLGLADLAHEKQKVRDTIGVHLNNLVRIGVSGFRVDAAKHIPAENISVILGRIDSPRPVRVVQEVIYRENEPIQPEECM